MDALRSMIPKLDKIYKDEFYAKTVIEMIEVTDRQRQIYQATKNPKMMDASLNDMITGLLMGGKEKEKDVRDLKNALKLNEKAYFMVVNRAFAKNKNWTDVASFIQMKKPPVPHAFLAEILYDEGNIPLAVEAIKKISDYDEKIPMLIDIGQWREAIEETYNGKKLDYLDDIRQKGPQFVE